jgi:molybdopterin molybdotransferase/putative molybdopterin biosynthesis protein
MTFNCPSISEPRSLRRSVPDEQVQFLEVVDRDTAERLWREVLCPRAFEAEQVPLSAALGRVLAVDITAEVDVPAFDRSNVDGYAVRAQETFGAAEETPRWFRLNPEVVATGVVPQVEVEPGSATSIATGGMLPRGADAVVMVEFTRLADDEVHVARPLAPGSNVSFAGTDMARGELVLRTGSRLTARETGILAAIGCDEVPVVRRPRVAIISTGDELIAPGTSMRPASVYDSNTTLLADAVRELGGEPVALGIIGDDERALDDVLDRALAYDLVLLSGGTSKGEGDLSYRVLARREPGLVVHGVALKPGKPICLGAVGRVPVAILPGFPTSAIFTFHEFVAPLIRCLAGLGPEPRETVPAILPMRFNSERGRTEYLLVNLVSGPSGFTAYPMGKGSGSVTTFSRADGFLVIPRQQEFVEAGETVQVVPLASGLKPADLVAIGSHCMGLDAVLSELASRGMTVKTIWVGSQGGLVAAGRGECDLAGVHLLDPVTDTYNAPFLPEGVRLVRGYGRMQGLVYRPGDCRFEGRGVYDAVESALADPSCMMVNRNRGSGTRVLIDALIGNRKPQGFAVEVRSHHGVGSAIAQGRADWGVAIAQVASAYGLAFTPIRAECFDFAVPAARWDRPPVVAFRELMRQPETRNQLRAMGFMIDPEELSR